MEYFVGTQQDIDDFNRDIWAWWHPDGCQSRGDQFIGTMDQDGVEVTEEYIRQIMKASFAPGDPAKYTKTFSDCIDSEEVFDQGYNIVYNFKKGCLTLDQSLSKAGERYSDPVETNDGRWAIPFHPCAVDVDIVLGVPVYTFPVGYISLEVVVDDGTLLDVDISLI